MVFRETHAAKAETNNQAQLLHARKEFCSTKAAFVRPIVIFVIAPTCLRACAS
jgi:hypothetical protein